MLEQERNTLYYSGRGVAPEETWRLIIREIEGLWLWLGTILGVGVVCGCLEALGPLLELRLLVAGLFLPGISMAGVPGFGMSGALTLCLAEQVMLRRRLLLLLLL